VYINPLNAELNPICHLLALLGVHHILHVSRIRVKHSLIYVLRNAKYNYGKIEYVPNLYTVDKLYTLHRVITRI